MAFMTLQGPRLGALAPELPKPSASARPWVVAIGGAALLGVAYLFWRSERKPRRRALRGLGAGPFYYLSYREALRRAQRLAAQTGSKVRVAVGEDDRAPGRLEYAVAEVGDVPTGFTVVAFADPSGDVKSSGSRHHRMMKRRGLGDVDLKTIAREARDAKDFAVRAEAWNHNQARRYKLSDAKLAAVYRKAKPATMKRLIADARQAREDGWAGIVAQRSRSLRGVDVTEKQQRMFKRGVEAMKRAMKGSPDVDRAFNVAIRASKDPDFAAGVRNVWARVSPHGDRDGADKILAKYGFKAG